MSDVFHTFRTIGDGIKTVTTAGTAVALVSSATEAREVLIQALSGNTSNVTVGASTVVAAAGSERGFTLVPNASITLRVKDIANIYVDAVVSGEGVSFTYFKD